MIDFNYDSIHENIKKKLEEDTYQDHSVLLSFAWNIIDYADKIYSLLDKISVAYYNQESELNRSPRSIRNTFHHLEERIEEFNKINGQYFGSLSFCKANEQGVYFNEEDKLVGHLVIITTGFISGKSYQWSPVLNKSIDSFYNKYNIIGLTLTTIEKIKNDHKKISIDLYDLRRDLKNIIYFIEEKHREIDQNVLFDNPEKIQRDISITINSN
ncbi:hypothetical protein ACYSNM_03415 [Myroides sp. LJL116]